MKSVICRASEVESSQRWDFAYHDPVYTELIKSLDRYYPVIRFGDIITLLTDMGAFSLYKTEFFVEEGVPFLRVQNIQEYGIDIAKDTKYISLEYHNQLKKSQLQLNDLLLTTKAVIGIAAVVKETLGECNISQNLVRIRLKNGIDPHYVAAFLNSRLGRIQTETAATGSNQKYLNFERIQDLKITLPPQYIQDRIAQIMQDTYARRQNKLSKAKRLYQEIDKYLLGKLGIDLIKLQIQRRTIKSIRSITYGRFDFKAVVTLQEINFGLMKPVLLQEVVRQVNQRVTPADEYANKNINYIGLGNITSNTGELVDFFPVKGEEILSSSPKFELGDILFGRMRPYLNKVWLAEFNGVCSGEAIVLRPNKKKVDPVFLQALLLSQVTLNQVVPLQSGTSLPRVSASDVFSIKLPIPEDLNKQKEISAEISRCRAEAKKLCVEAENLVNEAKTCVERIILGEENVT